MNDKQQLSAMGEHMREMEECKSEFKVPDGWILVPEVPTHEMIAGGSSAFWNDNKNTFGMYRAMLAAAPEYKP